MPGIDLPVELLDLLVRQVDPMAHVEALLLLHRTPERAWRVDEAAHTLHVDETATARHLAALIEGRLLRAEVDAGAPAYRYGPASPALHAAVDQLRVLYDTRPVSLVRALYERPPQAVRSFADAFRVRRPDE